MFRSIIYNIFYWPVFVGILAFMYPFTYFSKQGSYPAILTYRLLTYWSMFALKVFAGVKYEIRNIERVKDKQVIIGCNHQSTWETLIFTIIIGKLSMVIKQELRKKPLAGIYFEKLDCIPLDRSSPVKAIKSLLTHGKKFFEKGNTIVIFPNGTRSSADEHAEYKSGIYALYKTLNAPVVPASVNSGLCWPRQSFKKIPGTIILDFKEQIDPGLSKEEFFKTFEKRMS